MTSVRVGLADDADRYLATDQAVWFAEVPDATTERQLIGLHPDQRFAAELDGTAGAPVGGTEETYPGIYGVFPLTLSVPGPQERPWQRPCAGLTWVGVHPDHRRRGVLTAMMRHHLEQVHDQPGTHLSALHASEPAIYGRHGYGLASLELEVTLGRGTTLTAPHLEDAAGELTTALAAASHAGVPDRMRSCHLRSAELGAVVGDQGYYARICSALPEELRDKEPWRVLFARRGGDDVGFALFRRTHRWERARPAGELSVWALAGEPAAQLALLRRLVDFDLVSTVKVQTVGVEDPLLLWAGGPRATTDVATYDSLWVRLVDLPEALADRGWSAACDVVVEVADRTAPWNAGCWRIRADHTGEATVQRSSDEPELVLPVEALGAAYLGGGSLAALHRAGIIAERRRGAVLELGRAMRTQVAPSAAVGF